MPEVYLCHVSFTVVVKIRMCVDVWEEIGVIVIPLFFFFMENLHTEAEITAQSNVGGCLGECVHGCMSSCVSAAHMCARVFFPHVHPEPLGLHGEFQRRDEEGVRGRVGGAAVAA